MTISEAAVEAACRSEFPDWDTDGDEWWRGMTRKRMHKALEAAAPHLLADIEREMADAKRIIALLVSEAGGKAAISRKSVTELPADIVIETTQDIINGGWVIRAKARAAHGDD